MNAPATIKSAEPAWQKYFPAIDQFLPGRSDEEKRHRAGLMLLRDMATHAQRTASWEAAQAYAVVSAIAGANCMANVPVASLDALRLSLVRIYMGARALDGVFASPSDG